MERRLDLDLKRALACTWLTRAEASVNRETSAYVVARARRLVATARATSLEAAWQRRAMQPDVPGHPDGPLARRPARRLR